MAGAPILAGRRSWRRTGLAIGGLALALPGYWFVDTSAPSALPDTTAAPAPALVIATAPVPTEPVAAPRPAARAQAAAEPPTARADADSPHCAEAFGDADGASRQRWLTAMQSAGDERPRAAGWLIGLVDAGEEGGALRDRLATLAATSRDALVQAYAWRACRGDAALSSACQALAPDAWARLEPDNAAAWLATAVDPRLDAAAQRDALRRAAASTRLESHGPALHALAQAVQPAGTGALDRVMMARDIVEARADWLVSEALRQHCSARAVADASRVPVCDAIAALFAAKAQSLPDLLEARETGLRVGWPAERLDALRDEEQALAALDRQRFDAPQQLSCATLARQEAFYGDVGRLGEVAALREALQRAPR